MYRDSSSNGLKIFFALVLLFCIVGIISMGIVRIVKAVHFDQNCEGYLTRATNSGTVENAVAQLKIGLEYIEKEKLTEGFTSVMWKTPDEDLGFWYKNIKDTYTSLVELPKTSSELERSNALMKLREVLMSQGEKGSFITIPEGITIYPNNAGYMFFFWLMFGGAILSGIVIGLAEDW